jgi:MFS family permease/quinol monooxygenase YgiN
MTTLVPPAPTSTWSPLKQPVFRSLWLAAGASNIGSFMHDVGSAWLMTSLSPSPIMISLMQAAASLPFFLLALPAGALADVVDRRRLLLMTQSWMLAVAMLLGVLTLLNLTTPAILLGFTFALSLGSAMNMPVWQAVIPEVVSQEDLPAAATLNGVVINLARSIGPAVAGLIIAVAGSGAVFLVNAASFGGVIFVLARWRRQVVKTALPAERVMGAIQAGIRYARFSPPLQTVFIRAGSYIFFASAIFALLPLLARREMGLAPLGYGIILGCWGIGGLAGAFLLPKLRQRLTVDRLVAAASIVMGVMMLALAGIRNLPIICTLMPIIGIASLAVMVSLNVSAQTAVPGWVRARALAVHLLIFQGCLTLGSLTWGTIAQHTSIALSLMTAAIGLILSVFIVRPYRLRCAEKLDLTASLHWDHSPHAFEPCAQDGPVLITLEYRIDPAKATAFRAAMQTLSQSRRRDGAIQWGLFQDLTDPARFVETVIVESWAEHERQFERVTQADRAIESHALSFHLGPEPIKITEMIYSHCPESGDCA